MSPTASASGTGVSVTVENFTRAESDPYVRNVVEEGALGRFAHRRDSHLRRRGKA